MSTAANLPVERDRELRHSCFEPVTETQIRCRQAEISSLLRSPRSLLVRVLRRSNRLCKARRRQSMQAR